MPSPHIGILVPVLLILFAGIPSIVHASALCNDIELSPLDVTFQEGKDGKPFSIYIENESNETFEIDDVQVDESSPFFDISVEDFPNDIEKDDSEIIRLEYDTMDIADDEEDTFQIRIKGNFDDETCNFSELTFTVDVVIEDGENACSLITIQSNDVSIMEGVNTTHSISLKNNSNKDFTLQGFNVFDDAPFFSTTLDPSFGDSQFEKDLEANTSRNYSIELKAQNVSEDETDFVFIEIRGEFEDGVDCSFSEIDDEFEVTVEDAGTETSVCADIAIDTSPLYVTSGNTTTQTIAITNKTPHHFYIDEFSIKDVNYQVQFDTLAIPAFIPFNESDEVLIEGTGYAYSSSFDGNAFASMKGHFTNGNSCFVSAKKIPFYFTGSKGETCNAFYTNLSSVLVLKGIPQQDILIHNPLSTPAKVTLHTTHGEVVPNIVYVPSQTAKTQTIYFTDVSATSQTLTLTIEIDGCASKKSESTVLFSGLEDAPIQFKNPPTQLTIGNAPEFALTIENKSAYTQEAVVTITGKPGNTSYQKTITIPGLDSPLVYFPTSVIKGQSHVLIQLTSAGYTVAHTIYLLDNQPEIIISPLIRSTPTIQNEYILDVTIENNTPNTINGIVEVVIPSSWTITGNPNVSLSSGETKKITLTIQPSTVLSQPFTGMITLSGTPYPAGTYPITFHPKNSIGQGAAAFVSMVSGLWGGILLLILLIGAWYILKPKPPISSTDAIIHGKNTSSPSSIIEKEEGEPWMHPERE
ncbi:MAG: hypothetical protein V1776_04205 [Candidatus Diapherotrites archaeon]